MARIIMHLDMDSYFASVEQQANPSLRGIPIGVTGRPNESSIIVAASREAKRCGVKSAMPNWEALKLCPSLKLVSGKAERYIAMTKRFLFILKRYTPILEVFSIDEVFMDVTQESRRYGGAISMARLIKEEFREELGECITATIGIASNKAFAKLVAKRNKPDGIAQLSDEEVSSLLETVSVEDICGVGRRIGKRLSSVGIHTLADLGNAPENYLKQEFGIYGLFLKQIGQGYDPTPVIPYTTTIPVKSVGHSKSLPPQLRPFATALLVLRGLCDKVGRRMRKLGYVGRTIYFGFRLGSMGPHHGKQITLPFSTDDGQTIYDACLTVYRKMSIQPDNVSQVGVSVCNLTEKAGYPGYLLDKDQRRERLNNAVDHIRDRFGERSIFTGDTLLFDAIPEHVGGFSQGEEWEF
jgi:DNA polymerase IV